MTNPQNISNLYQNPQPSQMVTRDGDTRDMASILGATVRTGTTNGTLTIGTTAVEIKIGASPLEKRHMVMVINDSNKDIFIGFDSGTLTTSNGIPIWKNTERTFRFDPHESVAIYGISSSSGTIIKVVEVK